MLAGKKIYEIVYKDKTVDNGYFVSPFRSKASLDEAIKIFKKTIPDFEKTFEINEYEIKFLETRLVS